MELYIAIGSLFGLRLSSKTESQQTYFISEKIIRLFILIEKSMSIHDRTGGFLLKEFIFHWVYNCYARTVCIFCSFCNYLISFFLFFFFAVVVVKLLNTVWPFLSLPLLVQQVLHTALAFLFPLQFDSDVRWNPVIFVYFNEIRSLFALGWWFLQRAESVHQAKHDCIHQKEITRGYV